MSPKTIQKKVAELAELRKKLEAAEEELKSTKETLIAEVKAKFDDEVLGEMQALEITRIVVELGEEGLTVTIGDAVGKTAPRSNGASHSVEIPAEGIERKYKEKTYLLKVESDQLTVYVNGSKFGSYSSATAAAQGVVGSSKAMNGRAWWGLK